MFTKYLDPKNDVAFKKIFGTEKNKDILIHFLNDMITFKEGEPITEVTFLKTIQDPEIAINKTSIVDILCKDKDGNSYIVEMQVAKEKGFEKRAQYYAAKAYVSQMNVKGEYHDLKEIIFLAISNFTMFPDKKSFKSDHVILDRDNHEHNLKDFSFTFLELPKFNKSMDQLSSTIDKWAYFFKNARGTSDEDFLKLIANDEVMERAYKELDSVSWDKLELFTYEQAQKHEWDHNAIIAQKLDDKFDEGFEKGIEAGKIEIARNLLKNGMEINIVASVTDLTVQVVEEIK